MLQEEITLNCIRAGAPSLLTFYLPFSVPCPPAHPLCVQGPELGAHWLHRGWTQSRRYLVLHSPSPSPVSPPAQPPWALAGKSWLPHPDLSTAKHRSREKQPWLCSKCSRTGLWSWNVQFRHQIMCVCVCGHPWSGSPSPCLSPLDSNLGSSCWIRISWK